MAVDAPRRTKRHTFYVNATVSIALLIMLAVVSLVAQPPSPPSIAEFSPQTQQQIEEAPDEQSAQSGQSAAGASETIVIEDTEAAAEVAAERETLMLEGVPSALACVSWPDGSITQTFDPQSPPCIASWPESDQGNGGATSMGVTETEILVVMNTYTSEAHVQAFEQHFNSSYQFYGRMLRIQQVEQTAGGAEGNRAHAQDVVELEPFAALQIIGVGGSGGRAETFPVYRRTLVEGGVISLTDTSANLTRTELESHAPYSWSYGLPVDELMANLGEFACGSLAGRPADYAGPGTNTLPRKFAVMVGRTHEGVERDPSPLLDQLATCGVTPEVVEYDAFSDQMATVMADLQARQFTTLMMIDSGSEQSGLRVSARQLGYRPEWVQLGTLGQYEDSHWSGRGQNTWGSNETFGMAPTNKRLRVAQEPSRLAMTQGRGGDLPWGERTALPVYHQLLILASGIQMAGPNLTPDTFAAALQSTRFANPGAAATPFFQATVGFAGDHSFVDDVGLFWFSQGAVNERTGEQGGGYCYLDRGVRFQPGTWREDIASFDRIC